jgi:hypothetical protein
MKKIPILFLLLLLGVTFSTAVEDCLPKEALENNNLLEEYCSREFKSECICEIDTEISCVFEPTEELVITLGEDSTIEFMKFKTGNYLSVDNPSVVEYLCTSIVGYQCSCYKEGNEIRCTSEQAKFFVREETNGVRLVLSEYNAFVPYCEETSIIEKDEEKYSTTIEKNDEEQYEIKIENPEKTIQILAFSLNFYDDSSVSPNETSDEEIEQLEEILKNEYKGFDIEIIESIKIDLENIRDGEDIQSATIRFEIPKDKLNGEIIVIRIDDDGESTIIEPEIIDAGDYYIIIVNTDGLSLYAVATVNQISGTTPTPIEQEIKESSHLCGGIAGLILLFIGLLFVSKN